MQVVAKSGLDFSIAEVRTLRPWRLLALRKWCNLQLEFDLLSSRWALLSQLSVRC
jgi:hypothetical protein